jgi:predicted MFS family arabinose efflux permease
MMTGLAVIGIGIGGLVTPPLAQHLISTYGWPTAYTILGSVVLVVIVFAAQFLRRDPAQKGQLPYGHNESQERALNSGNNSISLKEAVHTRRFWLFLGMQSCLGFSIFSIRVHIAPHATELGFSAATAANILATMGGVSILGNVAFGNIGDRIGNKWTFFIVFFLMPAALFWLVPAAALWQLLLFVTVFGFANGGGSALPSPLAAELFGLKSHGLIFGVTSLGFTLGASIGPFLAGYIFDTTGSYQIAFLVSAAVGILGLILTILLRPVKRPEVTT